MVSPGAKDEYPAYPVFLDLERRLVVIVGGGARAERKARALLRYDPDLVVISPDVPDTLREMELDGLVSLVEREYVRGDLKGVFMVMCLDTSPEVMSAVHLEANESGCLVNTAAAPDRCNFRIPSQVRRGALQIAISTSGEAPTLAKRIRRELQSRYGPEWAEYVELFGEFRRLVIERVEGGAAQHDRVLDAVADSDVIDRVRAGEAPDAEDLFVEFVLEAPDRTEEPPRVEEED